jgi:hypothetical protein
MMPATPAHSHAQAALLRALPLLRWTGYGLLLLSLFDLLVILLPPSLMNPAWEFQTIGALVERAPVPLIGFVLIFLGEQELRRKGEARLLQVLSWLTVAAAIGFLLMAPIGLINTVRIDRQNNQQITAQAEQRLAIIQQAKANLGAATTPAAMSELLARLNGGNAPANSVPNAQQFQTAQGKLTEAIDREEKALGTQTKAARANQRLALVKNSLKWNVGAGVVAALFFQIWRSTGWARQRPPRFDARH